MRAVKLQHPTKEQLVAEVEKVRTRVRETAHALFQKRDGRIGSAFDDWLMAERDTVWRPAIEMSQHDGEIVVEAALAGLEPTEIDVQVTPDALVIAADRRHAHTKTKGTIHVCEFASGRLFRSIPLPAPIDPHDVKARYHNGLLTVTATLANRRPIAVQV